ncbi:unnamed protein product [Effrenium voratum]|nr:unnamed protein product [Effrenium voratum]
MAAYKKWFKELYPFQDDLEDLIWKSRAVLEQKEKTELGVESDPRHQLHLLRYQYKSQKVESDITAREAFGFGSASKPAEVPEEGFGPTEEMFEERKTCSALGAWSEQSLSLCLWGVFGFCYVLVGSQSGLEQA